jgi:hypothetical protein
MWFTTKTYYQGISKLGILVSKGEMTEQPNDKTVLG